MSEYYKMIRSWDIIIIFILILISLLPIVVFSYVQSEETNKDSTVIAVISVNNEVVERITLTGHTGVEIFDINSTKYEVNTIEIKDEGVRIKGATCSDQICVRTGFISKPGETIVCLPHKLLIEIETLNGEVDDIIISS